MKIKLKLMGMLKEKTPENGEMELAQGAVINDVLENLGVPEGTVKVFTVNGDVVRDTSFPLSEGDELTVLPPVGGG